MNTLLQKVGISALLSFSIAGVLVLTPVVSTPVAQAAPSTTTIAFSPEDVQKNLDESAGGLKQTTIGKLTKDGNSIGSVVGLVVSAILALMGLIFLILIIYGGITWMTAEGDEGKISKARGTIFHAVIGLIIVLSAYAITAFVLGRLVAPISS